MPEGRRGRPPLGHGTLATIMLENRRRESRIAPLLVWELLRLTLPRGWPPGIPPPPLLTGEAASSPA